MRIFQYLREITDGNYFKCHSSCTLLMGGCTTIIHSVIHAAYTMSHCLSKLNVNDVIWFMIPTVYIIFRWCIKNYVPIFEGSDVSMLCSDLVIQRKIFTLCPTYSYWCSLYTILVLYLIVACIICENFGEKKKLGIFQFFCTLAKTDVGKSNKYNIM